MAKSKTNSGRPKPTVRSVETLARQLIDDIEEMFRFTPDDYRRAAVEGKVLASKMLLKIALGTDSPKQPRPATPKPRGPKDDPEPPLCQHDDSSWCTEECERKAVAFRAWAARERARHLKKLERRIRLRKG